MKGEICIMEYYYITNNTKVAQICDENNVIPWVDLEVLGKEERQKGMNTVKSKHQISDISSIKKVLKNQELLVRINPINRNSKNEINQVIKEGADIIMLPYFKKKEEVEKFVDIVDKKCKTMLLFETRESIDNIDNILCIDGIDKVHIGLNDLHLSYGLSFMFELVTNGTVDYICQKFNEYGFKQYGFGGIARLGLGNVPAEYIISEHIRLKSTQTILSRSFCNIDNYKSIENFRTDFENELKKIEYCYKAISSCNKMFVDNNHIVTKNLINNLIVRGN